MEDKTSLWNTKQSDLTVGDSIKLAMITPVLVMGALVVAGGVLTTVGLIASKFRKTESVDLPETNEE